MKKKTVEKKYENVISLGNFCGPAMEIERLGFHSSSYPFDWLIVSNFDVVLQLIKNKFEGFLIEENLYQEISVNPKYYYNMILQIHFYHDFSEYVPLHDQLRKVQEKYARRIERFYSTIQKPTLFIRYCSGQKELNYIKENFEEINKLLKSFHQKNDIIYVTDLPAECTEGLNVELYSVNKDKGDTVARKLLKQCPAIRKILLEQINTDRKKNLRIYRKRRRRRIYNKIMLTLEKIDRKGLKLFADRRPIYRHDKTI